MLSITSKKGQVKRWMKNKAIPGHKPSMQKTLKMPSTIEEKRHTQAWEFVGKKQISIK